MVYCLFRAALAQADDTSRARMPARWYRGNTHMHSLWSDGDEFPEMAAAWYKEHGYHFVGLSDHNVLQQGERWVRVHDAKQPIPPTLLDRCRARFGANWVQTRGENENLEVRLKTLDEIRAALEEPRRFLMISAEEITGECGKKNIHLNALNLTEAIKPRQAATVAETIRLDVAAVAERAQREGRSMLVYLNHPNWEKYDIRPEEAAAVLPLRFFEVCNADPDVNHFGDAAHAGTEKWWDIANAIRAGRIQPPLFGVAGDDAHHYLQFSGRQCNPGRAWIMVRAAGLTPEAIIQALEAGDFYATTGVVLSELKYEPAAGTLHVEVMAQAGGQYAIEFVGTLAKNPDVGRILQTVEGTSATYTLTGDELYVRAVVRSNLAMSNSPTPDNAVKNQTAWTQPVGWQMRAMK
jgi:predicted metal-dependent phosphoesterase TrpH